MSTSDPNIERAMARVGTWLRGKWYLDRLIGVGGMAAVYAATHRNGKRGAVKLLHPSLSSDPNVRGRFLREGYVANKVGLWNLLTGKLVHEADTAQKVMLAAMTKPAPPRA